jgi:uncharacterized protein (TIGR00369 family)
MIILPKEDLHDQAGMERSFRSYFEYVKQECDGTFNCMLGAELVSCDYEKKTVLLKMETQSWMTNPSNMLHGGVTASILDMTMGLLCRYCSGGYMTPTIDMSVSYLRPAPLNETLYIQAQVTHRGMSVCHATGTAWAAGAQNKPVATASGSYYVTHTPGIKN